MKKFLLLALSLTLAAQCAQAKQISADEAMRNATQFARSASRLRSIASNRLSLAYTEKADGNNVIYVFNSAGPGFVVTAADDCAAPVLGYSETGTFNPADMPPALKEMFAQYSAEISAAIAAGCEAAPATAQTDTKKTIAPLVTTKWGQNEPFNNLCPKYDSTDRSVTGCVATAMAQIMSAYKHPTSCTGIKTYTTDTYGLEISLDFNTVNFDWNNITDTYSSSSTEAQNNAVATLMYSCGVAASMDYGPTSGSTNPHALRGFANYLGYDKSIKYAAHDYYSSTEWDELIYSELAAGRPVLYTGCSNFSSGHAFVCDGYSKDNYFHINWGWDGGYNGYFKLSALTPYGADIINSVSEDYNYKANIVYNIKPDEGNPFSHSVSVLGDFSTSGQYSTTNSSDVVKFNAGGIFHSSADTTGYKIKIIAKAVNNATNVATYIDSKEKEYDIYAGRYSYSLFFLPHFAASAFADLDDGTYTICPAYQHDSENYDMKVPYGYPAGCTLTKKGTSLTFTSETINPDLEFSTDSSANKFYTANNFLFSATVKNTGKKDFFNYIFPLIVDSNNNVVYTGSKQYVELATGQSDTFKFRGFIPYNFTTGTYTLKFGYYPGTHSDKEDEMKTLSGFTQSIEVKEAPSDDAALTSENPFVENRNNVTATDIRMSAKITCTAGFFCDGIHFGIYEKDENGEYSYIVSQQSNIISLEANESATATVLISEPDLVVGKTYYPVVLMFDGMKYKKLTEPKEETAFTVTQTYAGISEAEGNGGYTVYPSPATDVITVSAPALITAVEIYSASGQMVNKVLADGLTSTTVSVDGLAPGIYMVKTVTAQGTHVSRIIKQ